MERSPMAEIRADLCNFSVEEIEQLAATHTNILITCRIENSSREYAYEILTRAIIKGARYADVEIEAPYDHLEYIKSYAKANGCKLIISYHNFEGTNTAGELEQIYDLCLRKGADIVKIVTTAHNITDAVRTLSLYKTERYKKAGKGTLIAFAMGEAGKFTRHLCVAMGAPYTYAAYNNNTATAPGQYTFAEMEALLYPIKNVKDKRAGKITPVLPDKITIPCSKSVAQRAVLAAALSKGESILENFEPCEDINGALEAVKKLGCIISQEGNKININSDGSEAIGNLTRLETGESGLLTRLLIPLAGYISGLNKKEIEITGHGSLMKRNLSESAKALQSAGIICKTDGYLPFRISGEITCRNIEFSGKESSQIVSGFLMTLPLLPHDSTLTISDPASTPYIRLTLKILEQSGIKVETHTHTPDKIVYHIPGKQKYSAARLYMDSDWSSAAYFAVAGAIGHGVTLLNMPLNSDQADEAVLDILRLCGAEITITGNPTQERKNVIRMPVKEDTCKITDTAAVTISGNNNTYEKTPLHGTIRKTETEAFCKTENRNGTISGNGYTAANITIKAGELKTFDYDATDCPDLFPVLAVLASHCNGTSIIKGVNRLLQKESNRAESIFTEFTKLGADIDIRDDYMYITGTKLHGGYVSSHNDHRIAMSLIIAGMFTEEPVIPDDIKCINKSFPSFIGKLYGSTRVDGLINGNKI